jgi:MinD-like ATPase involved in chromosome partitioning or flagellar assembly
MPIITVHATKGGQGVTTITAALGVLHAQAGLRTLLIDTGGDLPAILGKPEPLSVGLSDYLIDPTITLGDITITVSEGLDLIPRGTGLSLSIRIPAASSPADATTTTPSSST